MLQQTECQKTAAVLGRQAINQCSGSVAAAPSGYYFLIAAGAWIAEPGTARYDQRGNPVSEFSEIIRAIEAGDPQAADRLLPLLYDELRKLAAKHLANERPGQTLQPTALAHEVYLRLVGGASPDVWNSRGHFMAAAAKAIRRILIENARRKSRLKRGGDLRRVDLPAEGAVALPELREDLLALDEALNRLAEVDPRAAELVQLLYFGGLTLGEAATTLGVSPRTAGRWWAAARAWLRREIESEGE